MRTTLALCAVILSLAPDSISAAPDSEIDTVMVRGESLEIAGIRSLNAEDIAPLRTDTASLLDWIPGGAVNRNGPLTGEIQIRGLSQDRVGVMIGGQRFASGGPNRMDPPLHYAPSALVESLDVTRGIASVSQGAETVGGMVHTHLRQSRFREGGQFEVDSQGSLTSRSANQSLDGGGIVSIANDRLRFHFLGAAEYGDDFDAADASVEPTEYRRNTIGGEIGFLLGRHELSLGYRRYETDNAGTPALPMDIELFDTDLIQAEYRAQFGDVTIEADFGQARIDHEMDNFRRRIPPPVPAASRNSEADSVTTNYAIRARLPVWIGELQVGGENVRTEHNQDIFNPNAAAFFVRNFNHVERDATSGFSEWNASLSENVDLELGVRYTRISMDAGAVDGTPAQLMPPPMSLRDAFNTADRSRTENLLDWVVKLSFSPTSRFRVEFGGGRKTRAPSYIERYAWLPLEVTAGLADGNNYIGDLGLDPEVFHEIEGGFIWTTDHFYLAPRAFYRRADDFIQGTPATNPTVVMVSTANGDPTPLQYTNVDAKMYGIDVEWVLQGPLGFELTGLASWVHARRRDITDSLYRIAPLRGRSALSWSAENWGAQVEAVVVGRQARVSKTNGESATGSYALANASAWWEPRSEVFRFEFGIENAFDRDYQDHLAGIKRTADGEIPLGSKLPGWGRNLYGRVLWRF